jgi:uncharacterized membrane protein (DUF4010 family)
MFFAVEVNVLLWLALLGMLVANRADAGRSVNVASDVRWMAGVGVAFAAIVQHWAYYALYKRARDLGRPSERIEA